MGTLYTPQFRTVKRLLRVYRVHRSVGFGPAERPKLSHAGPVDVDREAEPKPLSGVGCSDLLGVMFGIINNPLNNCIKVCAFGSQPLQHVEREKDLQEIIHAWRSLCRNLSNRTLKLSLGKLKHNCG